MLWRVMCSLWCVVYNPKVGGMGIVWDWEEILNSKEQRGKSRKKKK